MPEFILPKVGDAIHYVSPFIPDDGSERKCLDSVITYVRDNPHDVDVDLYGMDEHGNDFTVHWVMFRGFHVGYWYSEDIKGFQPHSWHYPENDELKGAARDDLAVAGNQ